MEILQPLTKHLILIITLGELRLSSRSDSAGAHFFQFLQNKLFRQYSVERIRDMYCNYYLS